MSASIKFDKVLTMPDDPSVLTPFADQTKLAAEAWSLSDCWGGGSAKPKNRVSGATAELTAGIQA